MRSTSDDLVIRRAVADDLPALRRLYAELDPPGSPEPDPARVAAVWQRICADGRYALWVLDMGGPVCATYSMLVMESLAHDQRPAALVENVVVAAALRGRGLGEALMRHAMDRAAEAGCYKLALSSNKRRLDAHRFYRRLGFADHGISLAVAIGTGR